MDSLREKERVEKLRRLTETRKQIKKRENFERISVKYQAKASKENATRMHGELQKKIEDLKKQKEQLNLILQGALDDLYAKQQKEQKPKSQEQKESQEQQRRREQQELEELQHPLQVKYSGKWCTENDLGDILRVKVGTLTRIEKRNIRYALYKLKNKLMDNTDDTNGTKPSNVQQEQQQQQKQQQQWPLSPLPQLIAIQPLPQPPLHPPPPWAQVEWQEWENCYYPVNETKLSIPLFPLP